jgi:hypothetical protein
MSSAENEFTGVWLHGGDKRGQTFTHSAADYDHPESEGNSSTKLRHAYVEQAGRKVGVWVPAHWSEQQVTEALETNW